MKKKVSKSEKKTINWDTVQQLLQAGCTQKEIAATCDVSHTTLKTHCMDNHDIPWSEYAEKYKAEGDGKLRCKLFGQALKGDKYLLVFMAKNRLGMSDNPVFDNAVANTGVLLVNNKMTPEEWAEKSRKHFDCNEAEAESGENQE
jgi:hypothetical protein